MSREPKDDIISMFTITYFYISVLFPSDNIPAFPSHCSNNTDLSSPLPIQQIATWASRANVNLISMSGEGNMIMIHPLNETVESHKTHPQPAELQPSLFYYENNDMLFHSQHVSTSSLTYPLNEHKWMEMKTWWMERDVLCFLLIDLSRWCCQPKLLNYSHHASWKSYANKKSKGAQNYFLELWLSFDGKIWVCNLNFCSRLI